MVTSNLNETTFLDPPFYWLKVILIEMELIQANKQVKPGFTNYQPQGLVNFNFNFLDKEYKKNDRNY